MTTPRDLTSAAISGVQDSRRTLRIAIAVMAVLYVMASWVAILLGSAVMSPCMSNFEGGCGYAKVIAAPISFAAAVGSFCTALAMTLFAAKLNWRLPIVCLVAMLGLPGLVYSGYCLYFFGAWIFLDLILPS